MSGAFLNSNCTFPFSGGTSPRNNGAPPLACTHLGRRCPEQFQRKAGALRFLVLTLLKSNPVAPFQSTHLRYSVLATSDGFPCLSDTLISINGARLSINGALLSIKGSSPSIILCGPHHRLCFHPNAKQSTSSNGTRTSIHGAGPPPLLASQHSEHSDSLERLSVLPMQSPSSRSSAHDFERVR